MPIKYISKTFDVEAAADATVASLLVPFKEAQITQVNLHGWALSVTADPNVVGQVSLSPVIFTSFKVTDAALAFWLDGGNLGSDIGLQRMSINHHFPCPNVPVAVGQSIYANLNAVNCNAFMYVTVWFKVIRQ